MIGLQALIHKSVHKSARFCKIWIEAGLHGKGLVAFAHLGISTVFKNHSLSSRPAFDRRQHFDQRFDSFPN